MSHLKRSFQRGWKKKTPCCSQNDDVHVDIVVGGDGSRNFVKVMDTVLVAPKYSKKRFVIKVKRGIYMENVIIGADKSNLMFIGDGMDITVISGNLSHHQNNLTTYKTSTFGKEINKLGWSLLSKQLDYVQDIYQNVLSYTY